MQSTVPILPKSSSVAQVKPIVQHIQLPPGSALIYIPPPKASLPLNRDVQTTFKDDLLKPKINKRDNSKKKVVIGKAQTKATRKKALKQSNNDDNPEVTLQKIKLKVTEDLRISSNCSENNGTPPGLVSQAAECTGESSQPLHIDEKFTFDVNVSENVDILLEPNPAPFREEDSESAQGEKHCEYVANKEIPAPLNADHLKNPAFEKHVDARSRTLPQVNRYTTDGSVFSDDARWSSCASKYLSYEGRLSHVSEEIRSYPSDYYSSTSSSAYYYSPIISSPEESSYSCSHNLNDPKHPANIPQHGLDESNPAYFSDFSVQGHHPQDTLHYEHSATIHRNSSKFYRPNSPASLSENSPYPQSSSHFERQVAGSSSSLSPNRSESNFTQLRQYSNHGIYRSVRLPPPYQHFDSELEEGAIYEHSPYKDFPQKTPDCPLQRPAEIKETVDLYPRDVIRNPTYDSIPKIRDYYERSSLTPYVYDRYHQGNYSHSYASSSNLHSEESTAHAVDYDSLSTPYESHACPQLVPEEQSHPGLYEEEPKDYSNRSAALREKKEDKDIQDFFENVVHLCSAGEAKNEVYLERQQLAQEALKNASSSQRAKTLKENFWIIEDEPLKLPRKAKNVNLMPTTSKAKVSSKKPLKEFICHICGVTLKGRSSLRNHLILHSGTKPHQCKFCHKSFAQQCSLKYHLRIHTGETPFKCSICQTLFKGLSHLRCHKARKHSSLRPFECVACLKTFKTNPDLRKHLNTHMAGPFQCSKCGEEFQKRRNLASHISSKHRDNPQRYPCPKCPKVYQFKSYLEQHIKVHQNEKKLLCQVCGAAFVWRSSLSAHLRTHFLKLQCEICEKKFASAKRLNKHRLLHSNPNHYKCSKCPKEFKYPFQVKAHEKRHKESLSCEVCGENFLSKRKFRVHSKVHS